MAKSKRERIVDSPLKMTIADIGDFPTPLDEIARRAEQGYDIHTNLARIEQNARRLIADPELADAPYILQDAVRAVGMLQDLKAAWENTDIPAATEAAFHLGTIDQRMTNRVCYDSHIRRGRGQLKALAKGPAKKAQKTAGRRKTIADAVKARMDKNKKETLHSAREHVAKNSEALLGEKCSFDTVKRATATIKPRKKMKK